MPLNILNATGQNKAPDFPPGVLLLLSWPVSSWEVVARCTRTSVAPCPSSPGRYPGPCLSLTTLGLVLCPPALLRADGTHPPVHTPCALLPVLYTRRESPHCPSLPGPAAGEGLPGRLAVGQPTEGTVDNGGRLQHGERLPGEQGLDGHAGELAQMKHVGR